jgi:CheY-like chemotaxis protein
MAEPQSLPSSAGPAPDPDPDGPPPAESASRRAGSQGRVLLVDDDPVNQYALGLLLRAAGFEVLIAEGGQAGVEAAAREKPDVVLMDLVMPEVDGYEATRRLKASPELRGIPVIMLTAAVMPGDWEMGFRAGCDGYLNKPIETSQLVETLRHWMGVVGAHPASGGTGR